MACANCLKLGALNAELELALEGAVFVTEPEVQRLSHVLGVSLQEAVILGVLARVESATRAELNQACAARRIGNAPRTRTHEDELQYSYAGVLVMHLRRRLGREQILSRPWSGYRLAPEMRARVLEVIGEQP